MVFLRPVILNFKLSLFIFLNNYNFDRSIEQINDSNSFQLVLSIFHFYYTSLNNKIRNINPTFTTNDDDDFLPLNINCFTKLPNRKFRFRVSNRKAGRERSKLNVIYRDVRRRIIYQWRQQAKIIVWRMWTISMRDRVVVSLTAQLSGLACGCTPTPFIIAIPRINAPIIHVLP